MAVPAETRAAQRRSLPQMMMSAIGARLTRALSTDEGDNVSVAETLVDKLGEPPPSVFKRVGKGEISWTR